MKGKYREWTGGTLKGTATIGYGHTNAALHPLKVVPGLRLTEPEAAKILDADLDECERDVNRLVKVPLTQGQFDALVSFTYNCGTGNLRKLIAPLNKGDYNGTRAKFPLYTRSKGQVLRGLVRRRTGEVGLWDANYAAAQPPRYVENVPEQVDTPKEPSTAKGVAIGGAATAAVIAGVTEGATAVGAVMSPVRAVTDALVEASLPALIVLVVLAIVGGGYLLWKNR